MVQHQLVLDHAAINVMLLNFAIRLAHTPQSVWDKELYGRVARLLLDFPKGVWDLGTRL